MPPSCSPLVAILRPLAPQGPLGPLRPLGRWAAVRPPLPSRCFPAASRFIAGATVAARGSPVERPPSGARAATENAPRCNGSAAVPAETPPSQRKRHLRCDAKRSNFFRMLSAGDILYGLADGGVFCLFGAAFQVFQAKAADRPAGCRPAGALKSTFTDFEQFCAQATHFGRSGIFPTSLPLQAASVTAAVRALRPRSPPDDASAGQRASHKSTHVIMREMRFIASPPAALQSHSPQKQSYARKKLPQNHIKEGESDA